MAFATPCIKKSYTSESRPVARAAGMPGSAHREAVEYFEQALSALSHLPEQRDRIEQAIDLRLALRSALQPAGDFTRILAYLREAESLAVALNDHLRLGQVLGFLSDSSQRIGA
jgi:hypothetical protein